MAAFWAQPTSVSDALTGVDTRWDDRLTRLSQHDEVFVGAGREELRFFSRQVLRAEVDGPDRWVVIAHLDEHDRPLPLVMARRGCQVGRVVQDPGAGLLVAELVFDQPLRRGETVITEHELVNQWPFPVATNYERKFRLPVRQYLLEVTFDVATLPSRCVRVSQGQIAEARIDAHGRVHGVALGYGPGCFGFQWEWA